MTSGPTRLGSNLSEALDRLEHAIFDPSRVEENERLAREHHESEQRSLRRERLDALGIELEKNTHRQVVANVGLKDTTSLVAVKRWLTSQNNWPMAVLTGNRGCGKSVAAAYVVANWDRSAAWSSAPDLLRVFSGNFGDVLKRQDTLKHARLLVLDDIGTEGDAARMCATLIELLDERKQRKTLITTNLSKAAFLERYADERLHSRLRELAGFVGDKGPDLRGQP